MISYETGGKYFLINVFKTDGSVFPKALVVSVPSAVISATFVACLYDLDILGDHFKDHESVMNNNAIWGGFSFLVGFLVVFRTSQAYSRFWEGCTQMHKMGAEWFDACSSLMAFCKHSEQDEHAILGFQNMLVRLFSMLHAAALGEIEDAGERLPTNDVQAFTMELIDAESIDFESLQAVKESDSRVELIFQWIQQYTVENIKTGVLAIPPPILSRSFQEIATGMVHFHEAMKISNVPFPFPYAQTCDALLMLHWIFVPFVVSQWCTMWWWAGVFSFIQVFTLWTLNLIAVELENPFGSDPNDIDGARMQLDMNNHLRLLLRGECMKTPHLRDAVASSKQHVDDMTATQRMLVDRAVSVSDGVRNSTSFQAIWECISIPEEGPAGAQFKRRYSAVANRPRRNSLGMSMPLERSARLDKMPLKDSASALSSHVFSDIADPSMSVAVQSRCARLTQDSAQSIQGRPSAPTWNEIHAAAERAHRSSSREQPIEAQPREHLSMKVEPPSSPAPPLDPFNGPPNVLLGKWEPVATSDSLVVPPPVQASAVDARTEDGRADLQLRLGEIFDQLDNGPYADGMWEEMQEGPDSYQSIARPIKLGCDIGLTRPPQHSAGGEDPSDIDCRQHFNCGVCTSTSQICRASERV